MVLSNNLRGGPRDFVTTAKNMFNFIIIDILFFLIHTFTKANILPTGQGG